VSKRINIALLWEAIVWAQYTYAELPQEEQTLRPQRPYLPQDGQAISPLIKATRDAYYKEKLAHGKAADFKRCKDLVVASAHSRCGWSEQTRNFYSSVVSIYITWDYGTQTAKTKRVLVVLRSVMAYIQQPREETCHARQGDQHED
jgi:hypothetical protein